MLLLGGLACAAVALAGMALGDSLWEFVAARCLGGIGVGMFLPAARAVVSRGERDRAGALLGRMASVELAGFITGPMIGSELVTNFELDTPFLVFGAIALFGLAVLSRLPIPEVDAETIAATARPGPFDSLKLLRRRPVLAAALIAAALFLPAGLYEAVWDVYLSDLGASTRFVGWSLAAYGVPFVLIAPFGGRLADRIGGMKVAMAALAFVVPLTVLYGFLNSYWLLASLVLFEAVFNGMGIPAGQAAMVRATAPEELAAGQGVAGAVGQIGAGMCAVVAGVAYDSVGPEVLFAGVAAVITVLGLAAWSLHRDHPAEAPAVAITSAGV
jgi:predicted MFS family arabinose efflux permease